MVKISITPAATLLSGLMVAIVAVVTLTISFFVVFGSIRDLGRVTAESLAHNSVLKIDAFFRMPLEDGKTIQTVVRRQPWSLPVDDVPVDWRHKWVLELDHVAAGRQWNYNSMSFLFADNSMVRMYTIAGASLAVSNDPRYFATTKKVEGYYDQYNVTTFEKSGLNVSLPAPPNFWDASPLVPIARGLSKNFSRGLDTYFFTTDLLIVTPDGAIVTASTNTPMHNSSGHLMGILAINLGLDDIEKLLEEAAASTINTEVFVVREKQKSIIATSHEFKSPNSTLLSKDYNFSKPVPAGCSYPDYVALPAEQWYMVCQVNVADHPYAPLRSFYAANKSIVAEKASFFTITSGGDSYYVVAQLLEYPHANVEVILIMPEKDILADVVAARNLSLVMSIILAVAACLVTAITIHLMLRPLSAMCGKLADTARLKLETDDKSDTSGSRPSPIKEIFDLQNAYNDMREKLVLVKRFVPHTVFAANYSATNLPSTTTSGGTVATSDHETFESMRHIELDGLASRTGEAPGELDADHLTAANPLANIHDQISNSNIVIATPLVLPVVTATAEEEEQATVGSRALSAAANKFRHRDCTVLCLLLPTGTIGKKDKSSIEALASESLWRVIQTVKANNGVIDQLRPDVFIATFNAHGRCVMHRKLAVKAALTITWLLSNEAAFNSNNLRFGIAVDAGEHLVGVCGSDEQRASVVIGKAYEHITKLAVMARDRYRCSVLATEDVTKGLSADVGISPLDVLEIEGTAKAVCEVTPAEMSHHALFAKAFSLIRQGHCGEASLLLGSLTLLGRELSSLDAARTNYRAKTFQMMARNAADGVPHLRSFLPFNWTLGIDEAAIIEDSAAVFSSSGNETDAPAHGEASSSSSTATKKKSLIDGNGARSASTHEAMGQKLQDAMQFKERPEEESLFPMFSQGGGGGGGGGSEYPDTISDVSNMKWTVSSRKLGKGASGAVILGQGEDGSLAALKFLPMFEGAKSPADLQHEVLMLSNLVHENITHYVTCAISDNYFVLITEFIAGGSLADAMKVFPSFAPNLLKRYATEMLEGLAYLHGQGMIHCDVKPHNVLITSEGSCKLADFGSAFERTKLSGGTIELRGTAWFMAPEVARGASISAAADMWSFGVTMLTLELGRLPWAPLKKGRPTNSTNFMAALAANEFELRDYEAEKEVSPVVKLVVKTCLVAEEQRVTAAQLLSRIT